MRVRGTHERAPVHTAAPGCAGRIFRIRRTGGVDAAGAQCRRSVGESRNRRRVETPSANRSSVGESKAGSILTLRAGSFGPHPSS
jgi:hypothetical protein